MATKEDEEVSLVHEEDIPVQSEVGDETGAVPSPPQTLGREEKRTCQNLLAQVLLTCCRLVAISAIVIVLFLVVVSAIYVIARPKQQTHVNYRLPPGAVPNTYDLRVKVDLERFYFWGSNSIVVNVTKPLKVITLHSSGLNITGVTLLNGGSSEPASKIAFEKETEFLILSFPSLEKWTASAPVQLTLFILYEAPLKTDLGGLYRSFYEESGEKRWMALTDFEPTGARHAFPCFDEPEMKARWTISVEAQTAYSVISNMPGTSTPTTSGWQLFSFQQSVPISTYLVCFVVSDFKALEGQTSDGIQVRVWTTPGTVEQCRYALECAVNILSNLTTYFAIPYPLPKMDLVAVPDFAAGAMENWGIVTFRQVLLLSDDAVSSASQKQSIAETIAHEFGHQWFGNLVTMRWWNDLWLNEGFASFVENIGTQAFRPEWKLWDQFVIALREPAFDVDSLVTSHPIASNVSNPLQIFQLFDAISYDKGASILRMLSAYLDSIDEGVFVQGLRLYLNTHKYGNAETEDLWSALGEVSRLPVPTIMNSWVNQAGYPYITLTATTGGFVAVQQRYFSETPASPPPKQLWYVPLLVQYEGEDFTHDYSLNFTDSSRVIPFTTQKAMIINPGQTAFFRTLYPESLLQALLVSPLLKSVDLAGIVSDQFSFIQAGLLTATAIFPTLESINTRKTRDYVPWVAVAGGLYGMRNLLINDPVYDPFQDFVQTLVADVVEHVGWDVANNSHLEKLLRPTILALASAFNYEPVLTYAANLFSQYRLGTIDDIAPDIRGIVYADAMQLGGETEWNWMLNRYRTSTQISEKLRALRSLAASSNTTLLRQTLAISLDESIVRSQDAFSLLAGVSGNAAGQRLAWDFFVENWSTYNEKFAGQMWFDRALNYIAAGFSTKEDYDMVEKFFKEHDLLSKFRGANQALESINANIAYLVRNLEALRSHFGFRQARKIVY